MPAIKTVLFDLDGTLLDTLPDLGNVLNIMRAERGMTALPLELIKPAISSGSKAMLKLAFDMDEYHPELSTTVEAFFDLYMQTLADKTTLFPGMDIVLNTLEQNNIPWGIVTNKPERFTSVLLDKLNLSARSACTVCGDTLKNRKPHPAPILHACEFMKCSPENTLYVGDAITDIIAGKAAGTFALAALYGYIAESDDPRLWMADGYIQQPTEIIQWMTEYSQKQ